MTQDQIHELVSLIEDAVCMRVDINTYDEIMPKVATVLYKRYCSKCGKIKEIDN